MSTISITMCFVNLPKLSDTFSISDVVSVISFITVLIGGAFALVQWNKNIRLKRADYLNALIEKLRTDPIIKESTKYFDYDHEWYSEDFHESEKENDFDYIFSFFSYICYLKSNHIIGEREFKMIKYEVNQVIDNEQTQQYLYNIYHFSRSNHTPCSFYYLVEYAKKRKVLSKEFFNPKSKKYPHYLNF